MTRLETLHREISEIDRVTTRASLKVFAFVYLFLFLLVLAQLINVMQFFVSCSVFAPVISWALNNAWKAQQERNQRRSSLGDEMMDLRLKIRNLFLNYETRKKGETFKKAYSLQGRSLRELKRLLRSECFMNDERYLLLLSCVMELQYE